MIQLPPKVTVEVNEDTQTVTEFIDYRNSQIHEDRPKSLPCDYCTRESDRLWIRATRGFCLRVGGGMLVVDAGAWGSCVFCKPLVDAGDFRATAARAAILIAGPPASFFEPTHMVVMQCFEDSPEDLWEAGMPRPT